MLRRHGYFPERRSFLLEKMEDKTQFYKRRGLVRTLADGCGMVAVCRKAAFKSLLVPAAARAAGMALAVALVTRYAGEHLLAVYRMGQAGAPSEILKAVLVPSVGEGAALALSLLVALCLHYVYVGRVNDTLRAYAEGGELTGRWLSRGDLVSAARTGVHALASDAFFFLSGAVLLGAALAAVAKWGGAVWAAAVLSLFWVYLSHARGLARCLRAFAGKGLAQSLRLASWRVWLQVFPLRLLLFFPLLVFGCIALMPVAVYAATVLTAFDSSLLGDGMALTPAVYAGCGAVNAVCFLLFSLVRAAAYWPLALGVANAKGAEAPVQ